jgi:hypothetical protein
LRHTAPRSSCGCTGSRRSCASGDQQMAPDKQCGRLEYVATLENMELGLVVLITFGNKTTCPHPCNRVTTGGRVRTDTSTNQRGYRVKAAIFPLKCRISVITFGNN